MKERRTRMKIGVFDSGYGGLTILREIRRVLPEYDYLYLGDNARAPYGTHSFDVIYRYTLEAVRYLLAQDCALMILACNTASAKALRTIQQKDLPEINGYGKPVTGYRKRNVLGVIRPTVEAVPGITKTGHVGILGTPATVSSESYVLELEKIAEYRNTGTPESRNAGIAEQRNSETSRPRDFETSKEGKGQSGTEPVESQKMVITQQACPMWVPLIEAGEQNSDGADYFVEKYLREILEKDPQIDTLVLGCTHYPLLKEKIDRFADRIRTAGADRAQTYSPIRIIAQGELVAKSLADYLARHAEYREQLSTGGTCRYLTTENAERFAQTATQFLNTPIQAESIQLGI